MPPGPLIVERYRKWLQSLPAGEADRPYLMKFGRYWTPREVLHEMEAGTPEGRDFQAAEEKLLGYLSELKKRV